MKKIMPMYKSSFLSHVKLACHRLQLEFDYIDINGRLALVQKNSNSSFFGASPIKLWPFNSAISMSITNDKDLTCRILEKENLYVPKTLTGCYDVSRYSHLSNPPVTIYDLIDKIELNFPIVVKPNDSKAGEGISIIHEQSSINEAIKLASLISNVILIQEYISGRDYRVYSYKGAPLLLIERSTTTFFGDGKTTVSELIKSKQKNQTFSQKTFQISFNSFLKKIGNIIFDKGRPIEVFPISNFAQGAKALNIIEEFPQEWGELCHSIHKVMKLDFFAVDCRIKNSANTDIYVIEVNSNPGIEMIYDVSTEKGDKMLDFLITEALNIQ